ncbi:hypothetical protein FRC11_005188, partial [Ceratobasidium sp. 423]
DNDLGTARNDAQSHRELLVSCEKAPAALPPLSSLSSFYSTQSIPTPIKLLNPGKTAKKGKVSAKQPVGGDSDLSNSDDDLHDYGSDTETVTTLYENKCAPNDKTIVSVSQLFYTIDLLNQTWIGRDR